MNDTIRPSALWGAATLALMGCAATYVPETVESRRPAPLVAPRTTAADDEPPADESDSAHAEVLANPELDAYVRYGLEHSARLRSAFEHWRAATERVAQAEALPDPRLTWAEFLEEIQTRTGPMERRIGISQEFPWFGQRGARGRQASKRADAMASALEVERLEVVRDIEVAFHEYAFLGRELRITAELLELLQGLEPVVQSRVRAGAGQEDILRLQVEIGRLEDDLASLERRQPALSARLADALTWTQRDGTLPLPELREPVSVPVDTDEAYTRALNGPRLRALDEELGAGREALEVARYRRKPSFALGLEYYQVGEAVAPGVSDSGNDPLAVSLSISLPVWTASYRAAEREARHLVRATRGRIESAESALLAALEEEGYQMDDAARRVGLYRDSLIPRADEALQLTLASYRTGKASLLDLIDSERALLEFELSFWRACRDYLQSDARRRAWIGEVVQ